MQSSKIMCYCSNVTKEQIIAAITNGAQTLDDIRKVTDACTIGRCKELSPRKRCCSSDILRLLKESSGK